MPVVVAFGNLKGGVGKTTLAVNVACGLAATQRVHLIDADPQASALDWCRAGTLPTTVEGYPYNSAAEFQEWADHIKAAAAAVVLVDLPAGPAQAVVSGMMVADLLVVPCGPSATDLRATAKAVAAVHQVRRLQRDGRPLCLLVSNRADHRTVAGRRAEPDLQALGVMLGPAVSLRSAFLDAAYADQWIGDCAPWSVAHLEIAALAEAVIRLARTIVPPAVRG